MTYIWPSVVQVRPRAPALQFSHLELCFLMWLGGCLLALGLFCGEMVQRCISKSA